MKARSQHAYRRRYTPAQHAAFLQSAANVDFTNPYPTASSDPGVNAQAEYDHFYSVALQLLNQHYPKRVVTKTSQDPVYVTPHIKAMLRRKNRLMRAGRLEKAGALSVRIGQAIECRCRMQLSRYNGKTDAGSMWAAVRRLTGRQQSSALMVDGITAETLNQHHASVSTDLQYAAPIRKQSIADVDEPPQCVSEWDTFRMLDALRSTSAGLDGLPSWFLRVASPVFCKPVSYLFNLSLCTSNTVEGS